MKQINIEAHYYDLLDDYLKDYPENNEKDFIENEINFYKDFIEKLEKQPVTKEMPIEFKKHWLIEYKKYYNYFLDKLRTIPKEDRNTKGNLLEGKKINLSERYRIANEMFNLDKTIRTLNIQDKEKYKLLAIILDCNETNARLIMNGNYQGKIREDLIHKYLKSLK
jgi:hypothetical protein